MHVVDASHPDPAGQIRTVRDVIGEVDAASIPEIIAFNKSDLISDERRMELRGLEPRAVFVSAATGEGIDALLERIEDEIPQPSEDVELLIPYSRGDLLSLMHENGAIEDLRHGEHGTFVRARLHPDQLGLVNEYRLDGDAPSSREPEVRHKPRQIDDGDRRPTEVSLPRAYEASSPS